MRFYSIHQNNKDVMCLDRSWGCC